MNTTHRFFSHSSQLIITAIVVVAALAGVEPVQASPDPPVYITNGVALFQGNQSNGIASGVDFQPAQVNDAQCEFVDWADPARQWRFRH